MDRHALVGRPAPRARFARADFAWFAAATYPSAGEADLNLVADWLAWLFVLDDRLDDDAIGVDPILTRRLVTELVSVLADDAAQAPRGASALATALADLWQRTSPRMTPAWSARFVGHVVASGRAAGWEARNRARGVVPDEPTYVAMRRHTGAIYVCMDLVEVVSGLRLPNDAYYGPPLQRALRAACDVVGWTNDVCSLAKETALGQKHNLVTVVGAARQLSIEDATNHVVAAIANRVGAFQRHSEEILRDRSEHREELAAYVDGMRSWMRGNLDWSIRTARYLQWMTGPAGDSAAEPAEPAGHRRRGGLG